MIFDSATKTQTILLINMKIVHSISFGSNKRTVLFKILIGKFDVEAFNDCTIIQLQLLGFLFVGIYV